MRVRSGKGKRGLMEPHLVPNPGLVQDFNQSPFPPGFHLRFVGSHESSLMLKMEIMPTIYPAHFSKFQALF